MRTCECCGAKICIDCGKAIWPIGSDRCQGCASKVRWRDYQAHLWKCISCGKPISKGQSHCRSCAQKEGRKKRGTTERQRLNVTKEYRNFIKSIQEREKYRCQDCGITNGMGHSITFHVHHIKSWTEFPELRYIPSNVLLLCAKCHKRRHQGQPRPQGILIPTPRKCHICGQSYFAKFRTRFCDSCRKTFACPICGSSCCRHAARPKADQAALILKGHNASLPMSNPP